ncbi:MAG: hypothetical protein ABL865_02680 [Candidatus Nitrotoga sp.]
MKGNDIHDMTYMTVRTGGLLRAKIKIGMMNLVYNMVHLVQLTRRDGIATSAIGKVA